MILSRKGLRGSSREGWREGLCMCQPWGKGRDELTAHEKKRGREGGREGGRESSASIIVEEVVVVVMRNLNPV